MDTSKQYDSNADDPLVSLLVITGFFVVRLPA